MKKKLFCLLSLLLLACGNPAVAQTNKDWQKYVPLIKQTLSKDYKKMFREKGGALQYPFIVPGSAQYNDVLWDWDSWLMDIAPRQVLLETGTEQDCADAVAYEQGCILNFLSGSSGDGWMPIFMGRNPVKRPKDIYSENMHIRSNGMSIALLINQAVSTGIAATFLPTVGKYGYSALFFAFAGCTVVYFITAAFFLPETKGKTLEEIEEHFEGYK